MANNLNVGRIPYSLGIRPTNPSDKDSEKKIFAYAQAETVNTRQLANHWAAHTSSFSKGECVGIIEDLCAEIQEMLLEGHAVYLEGLGKLYITLSSEGVDDAEKFSPAAHIRRVNVRFAADKAFLGTINATAQYELVTSREQQAAALKAQKEAITTELGGGSDGGGNGGGDVTE